MRTILITAIVALAGCRVVAVTESTDYDSYHMFGDRLDASRGVRMLCWPADADGTRFRCVEDRVDREIKEQPVMLWPDDARLAGCTGCAIVILPTDASEKLRSRATQLADDLTRGSPGAGRHFVTGDAPWQDVTDGPAVALKLKELHQKARQWRATEAEDGLFLNFDEMSRLHPAVVVVLGEEDQHLVLQGIRRKSPATSAWEAESRKRLSSEAIRALPQLATEDGTPVPMVFDILVPEALGEAGRERGAQLAADLIARESRTAVYLRTGGRQRMIEADAPPRFELPYIYEGPLVRFPPDEGGER